MLHEIKCRTARAQVDDVTIWGARRRRDRRHAADTRTRECRGVLSPHPLHRPHLFSGASEHSTAQ